MGTAMPDQPEEGIFSSYIYKNFNNEASDGLIYDFVIDTDNPQDLELHALRLARIKFPGQEMNRSNIINTFAEVVSSTDEDYPSAEDVLLIPDSEFVSSSVGTSSDGDLEFVAATDSSSGNESGSVSPVVVAHESSVGGSTSCDHVSSTTGNSFPDGPTKINEEGRGATGSDPVTRNRRNLNVSIPSPPGSTFSNVSDFSISSIWDSLGDVMAEMRDSPDFLSVLAAETNTSSFLQDLAGCEEQEQQRPTMLENFGQLTPVSQPSPRSPDKDVGISETIRKPTWNNFGEDSPSSCIPTLKSRVPKGASLKRMNSFRIKKTKSPQTKAPQKEKQGESGITSGHAYNLRHKANPKNFKNSAKKRVRRVHIPMDPRITVKDKNLNYGAEPIVAIIPTLLPIDWKGLRREKDNSETESASSETEESGKSSRSSSITRKRSKSSLKPNENNSEDDDDRNDNRTNSPSIIGGKPFVSNPPPKPKNPYYRFRFQIPKTPNREQQGWKLFEEGRIPRPPDFVHKHPQILPCSLTSISTEMRPVFRKDNSPNGCSDGKCSPTI